MPFDDFNPPAMPRNAETSREFRRLSIEFIEARNRRIDALVNQAREPRAAAAGFHCC
jgi:hypothetical protein